jgi:hypothetical protein
MAQGMELYTINKAFNTWQEGNNHLIAIVSVFESEATDKFLFKRMIAMWNNNKLEFLPNDYLFISPMNFISLETLHKKYNQDYFRLIINNEAKQFVKKGHTLTYHETKFIKLPQTILDHIEDQHYSYETIDLTSEGLDTRNKHRKHSDSEKWNKNYQSLSSPKNLSKY